MMEIEPPPTTIQRWKWNMRPYRRALGLGGRRRAGVLMYHRVADEISDPWGLCVTPDHFAQHMELLARHNAQIDLADLHGRKGYAPFGRRIAVTFDDGYLDNFTQAVPILERYGIPATIFVVAGLSMLALPIETRGRPSYVLCCLMYPRPHVAVTLTSRYLYSY